MKPWNILHFLTECNDELIVRTKEEVFEHVKINLEELKTIKPLKLLKFAKINNTEIFK